MAVTLADIKKLRDMTGAGMMDVKKALEEANGDFEVAKDLLRKRGQAIAAKRSDREASESPRIAMLYVHASIQKPHLLYTLPCDTCCQRTYPSTSYPYRLTPFQQLPHLLQYCSTHAGMPYSPLHYVSISLQDVYSSYLSVISQPLLHPSFSTSSAAIYSLL